MSSVLSDLGNLHIFTAVVAADGASMTTNDGSASLATIGDGTFTITWGTAFLTAPTVNATCVDAYSKDTTGVCNASITSLSTTALVLQAAHGGDSGADGAPVDAIIHVIAIGVRNI